MCPSVDSEDFSPEESAIYDELTGVSRAAAYELQHIHAEQHLRGMLKLTPRLAIAIITLGGLGAGIMFNLPYLF